MPRPEYVATRRASILDVAARAGVSRQTVTRAMNDMPGISEATKQRVLEAARELHYRPSRFGRGLVTQGMPTLGLVIVDLTNSFWAELASHVLAAASRHGWSVLIAESAHGGAAVVDNLATQVDAVFGPFDLADGRLEELLGAMPLVLFDREPGARSRATIALDFGTAMDAAIGHLLSTGRQGIVMLDWSVTDAPSRRARQFAEVMRARGLKPRLLRGRTIADPDLAAGRAAAEEARQRWPDVDALLCFNDAVAVGVIKQLGDSGVAVPDDIAVVGIDGLPLGLVVTPELTTLRFDLEGVAELAMELTVEITAGRLPLRGLEVQRSVSPELIVRRSS